MSIFSNFFKIKNNPKKDYPWIELSSINQLKQIIEDSDKEPYLIFKHSTTCGISRFVKGNFEKEALAINLTIKSYYLDLLVNRDISDAIEELLGVKHESPQVLCIFNKKISFTASHNEVRAKELKQFEISI